LKSKTKSSPSILHSSPLELDQIQKKVVPQLLPPQNPSLNENYKAQQQEDCLEAYLQEKIRRTNLLLQDFLKLDSPDDDQKIPNLLPEDFSDMEEESLSSPPKRNSQETQVTELVTSDLKEYSSLNQNILNENNIRCDEISVKKGMDYEPVATRTRQKLETNQVSKNNTPRKKKKKKKKN